MCCKMRYGAYGPPAVEVPHVPVRMTERLNDLMLLTTDADFRIYRRHGRQIIPCALPRQRMLIV
jgi:hypothetical protein